MAADLMWHHGLTDHSPGALTVQWRQWSRRDALDGLLIDGAPADSSPELALRALRLTRESNRLRLAAELEAIVSAADRGEHSRTVLDLRVDEVRAARGGLLELAARLYDGPCGARGVAMTRRLLRDPKSPLYEPAGSDPLGQAARTAMLALEQSSCLESVVRRQSAGGCSAAMPEPAAVPGPEHPLVRTPRPAPAGVSRGQD
jgi:hypothetical protein